MNSSFAAATVITVGVLVFRVAAPVGLALPFTVYAGYKTDHNTRADKPRLKSNEENNCEREGTNFGIGIIGPGRQEDIAVRCGDVV